MAKAAWAAALLLVLSSCDQRSPSDFAPRVRISEVVSSNDGVWVDERGETDDYVELQNVSDETVSLARFTLSDQSGERAVLGQVELEPGEVALLWADGSPEQGALHLPFRVDADGERLELRDSYGQLLDRVEVPALSVNASFSRFAQTGEPGVCRYATPERDNGEQCGPPEPPEIDDEVTFAPFTWPEPWPVLEGPVVLTELALVPAAFVELLNTSAEPVELADFALRVAPTAPGIPWPTPTEGIELAWPLETLEPGERVAVTVSDLDAAGVALNPAFEGVVTVFERSNGRVVDRVDFMSWPEGATLTRIPDDTGRLRFCALQSPGEANEPCDPLASRPVADRLRHFYTPGDFAALAQGETNAAALGVKFVIDQQSGDVVHLLGNSDWALHYTFIRERIDGEAPLDRCDPMDAQRFDAGWRAFGDREYFRADGRRYLLGTLYEHAGSGLQTLEFALGDQIRAEQMEHAFFTVLEHVDEPQRWSLRPSEPRQVTELREIEGRAPIVGPNAPFQGIEYQALNEGVAFGLLQFVPAEELSEAALGRDVIVITDDVPNDIPLVAGLVTEAFQTPLAHVNILSRNRSTPNMALRGAREDAELAPLVGELVRLEVRASGFAVERADPAEAEAFYEARTPQGPRLAPRRDLSLRGIFPLAQRSLADLPSIGAKAAQLAELARVSATTCGGPVPVPADGFAIPVVHYVEHFEASGASELLEQALADSRFRTDPEERARRLAEIRAAIAARPVDRSLLGQVESAIEQRYGDARVRLRSSSNTEDLPQFSGAGLYTSTSAALHDPARTVQAAIHVVWASLWSLRAYDEREVGHIDQTQVAMGILVHLASLSERANAVAISRSVLDPTRSDVHYLNAQIGEASVANPAPGVTSEQLLFHFRFVPNTPRIEYQSKSSLARGADVLAASEVERIGCFLDAIHRHFKARIDPQNENRWFAVDIELKLLAPDRRLLIKQARPYSFGRADVPADCREF